jgi:phosphoribosylaminoimidazole-succinocarboxamide synthase
MLVVTDRLSAFDRIIARIPFKGQVLNQLSAFWFEQTQDIVANHLIDVPDPNVTIARACEVFPIEFAVRGYLTGSTDTAAWTLYRKGVRDICGNVLPDGMVKNQPFARPILTPTTKSDEHDEPISAADIVARGLIDRQTWDQLADTALRLFARGQEIARRTGLILVDTKYEMGRTPDGGICLIDEVHTPDSSRYWIADTYDERFARGQEPENIDKEFIRLWFRDHCDPYADKVLPAAPDDLVVELSSRYIRLYEMITGRAFEPALGEPVAARMRRNLARYLKAPKGTTDGKRAR